MDWGPSPNYGGFEPCASVSVTLSTLPTEKQAASATPAPPENLAELVERVTFHDEESGFCVLRLKARGRRVVSQLEFPAGSHAGSCAKLAQRYSSRQNGEMVLLLFGYAKRGGWWPPPARSR